MNKSIFFFLFVCCFLCFSSHSNAAQVPVTLTINEILTSDNPYSLSRGDTFDWQVQYDSTKIITSGGDEWVYLGSDPSMQVDGIIGNFSFGINDMLFGLLSPALHFTGGALDGFFMMFVLDAPYNNMMGGAQYQCIDATDDTLIYTGTFAFDGTPVPLPGSFILLLQGIGGLALFRKKLKLKHT